MKNKITFDPCTKSVYLNGKEIIKNVSWDDGISLTVCNVNIRSDFAKMLKERGSMTIWRGEKCKHLATCKEITPSQIAEGWSKTNKEICPVCGKQQTFHGLNVFGKDANNLFLKERLYELENR